MSAVIDRVLPAYVGVCPIRHRQVVFGLENPFSVWDDLCPLVKEEWEYYGREYGQTGFDPDYTSYIQMAEAGCMAVATIRHIRTGALMGYFIGKVGPLMSEIGTLLLYELAFYIRKHARKHHTFDHFLSYVERVAKHFSCDGVVLTHLSALPATGRLFQQHGYQPLTCNYLKRLNHGPP